MKSLVGVISLLVFIGLAALAAGNFIDNMKAQMPKCTDTRAALGLCTPEGAKK